MKGYFIYIITLLVTLGLYSCKSDKGLTLEEIEQIVSDLKTKEDKKRYLESIYFENESLLIDEEKILNSNGEDSDEYTQFLRRKSKLEDQYINMVAAYFDEFGYPSRTELGQYASIVPLIVYFYATDNKGFRKDHFKYFYGAYKFKDIPERHFLAYIRGFYEAREGEIFIPNQNKVTAEEEIYAIMDAMGYDY